MEDSETADEYKPKLPQKEIEKKLLNHFIFLKEENKLNRFYSEFNIDDEDKLIINIWENIINYIYDEIFHCMSLSIVNLKQSTQIKDKIPLDFKQILQYLIYNKKYILQEDLKNEKFYIYNFPNLYQKNSYFSSLYNYLPSFEFCKTKDNQDDENDFEEETKIRKDLSKNYLTLIIPDNSIIINYKIFKSHCDAILITLKDILNEKENDIIIKSDFIDIIRKQYINPSLDNGKFKLAYGLQLIEEAIFYLNHTKQIIIFKIKESQDIEFIKTSKNKDDKENEEDIKNATKLYEEFQKEFEVIE